MDDEWFLALSLAKQGFGGGRPQEIMGMPVDEVMDIVSFITYLHDYSETHAKLNQKADENR
jgi:hypothetical protein